MSNHTNFQSFFGLASRPELFAGLLGGIGLIAIMLSFQSPWVVTLLPFAIISCAVFWWGIEYLPLIILLQLAFSVELQITGSTRLTVPTEVLIPIFFLVVGVSILWKAKITYRPSPLNVMVILMYCVMVASLRHSLAPISTIKAIVRDTGYMITGYYLIPQYLKTEKQLRQIVYGCLGFHIVLVLYGFLTQAIGGFQIYGDIAYPFFVEHCIYAAFITISFAFLLAFYMEMPSTGYLRFLIGSISTLFGVAIIVTFVRAAWISVLFLLLFYLVQFRNRKSTVDMIVMLIVLVLLMVVVSVTTDLGGKILTRLDTITDINYSANLDRIDRWNVAWEIWVDHPYIGVGWGAYPDEYFKYSPYYKLYVSGYGQYVPYSVAFRMGAHNIYLELLAEVGVVGLIMYLLMIYVFFRRAILLQNTTKNPFFRTFLIGAQGAMITYLTHAFVNNLGPSDKIGLTFWFLLGMIPTLEAINRMEEKTR